jgi:hypothetical protein
MATVDHFLDLYLDPVADAMTPEFARKVVDLQPDAAVAARVQTLGEKCNAGTLTAEEEGEYRALANAGTLVSLLKAKARRFLARGST